MATTVCVGLVMFIVARSLEPKYDKLIYVYVFVYCDLRTHNVFIYSLKFKEVFGFRTILGGISALAKSEKQAYINAMFALVAVGWWASFTFILHTLPQA